MPTLGFCEIVITVKHEIDFFQSDSDRFHLVNESGNRSVATHLPYV